LAHPIGNTDPSDKGGSASPDGTPSRIVLRRSLALPVYFCFAPRLGGLQTVPLTLAVLTLLASAGSACASAEPGALKIGPDGLSVWSRRGDIFTHGQILGCSQWSGWLLILAVAPDGARPRRLLIAADALPDDVFRKLAVLGRRVAYTL